jgi:hypothetical protein
VTAFDTAPPHALPRALPPTDTRRLVAVAGLTVLLSELVFLGGAYVQGFFIADHAGHGIANDFVNVWAAGRLVLDGHAAQAYDWNIHREMQEAAVGHAFDGAYRWHYPPPFLFAAAAVATLPYISAGIAWLVATGAAYATAIRGIVGERVGWLIALGFPGALWNVTAGQNSFITTALIGGALGLLERHPTLAGICLGLLTFKPQFGVLFPLVLVATGRWRAVASAAATTIVLAALSIVAFGSAPWLALTHSVATANQLVLADGGMGWSKLQSVFGLVRALGGGETLAWIVHGSCAVAAAIAVTLLWRSRAPYDLKAAALTTAAVLVTPYAFAYDMVLLAVPYAFLLRFGLVRGFLRFESLGFIAAGALLLSYIVPTTQVGLAATLIIALLIARRIRDCARAPRDTATSIA